MKTMAKRILMALCGIILTGMGIALMKTADMGTDPFSCFTLGISKATGISFSIIFTAVTCVLLIGVFVVNKHYTGISTILNMLLTGVITEQSMLVLEKVFPHPSIWEKLMLLVAALILICFSASLYYTADLGVSAYDAWALILSEKGVLRFRFCRIGTDSICAAAGLAMGIVPGIGTLLTAFCMGPMIELFNRYLSVPLLRGELHLGRPKLKKAA